MDLNGAELLYLGHTQNFPSPETRPHKGCYSAACRFREPSDPEREKLTVMAIPVSLCVLGIGF